MTRSADLRNKAAAGVPFYTPAQDPPAASALDPDTAPVLFRPLKMRNVTLHNRIGVSPMCMYSADDGHLSDFHVAHLGQFALHGAGLVFVEATAVEPRGRISPEDSGIWADSHVAPLRRIVDLLHSQGTHAAIQLAHAGRKASTLAPWIGGTAKKTIAEASENGWPDDVVAPSEIPYAEGYPHPKALTVAEIKGLVQAFADGATRAVKAGFDIIEIHGAHGYLINEFLSPLSNRRTDDYGGSFENRIRFLQEVTAAVRAVIPADMPLWLRISASEWMEYAGEPSWDNKSSIRLAKLLPGMGIDVLDVSSGANNSKQHIAPHQSYQVDLAAEIRRAVRADGLHLLIAAVGAIDDTETARSIVEGNAPEGPCTGALGNGDRENGAKADLVLAARHFLREPEWPLRLATELGVPVKWPNQYSLAPRRKPKGVY